MRLLDSLEARQRPSAAEQAYDIEARAWAPATEADRPIDDVAAGCADGPAGGGAADDVANVLLPPLGQHYTAKWAEIDAEDAAAAAAAAAAGENEGCGAAAATTPVPVAVVAPTLASPAAPPLRDLLSELLASFEASPAPMAPQQRRAAAASSAAAAAAFTPPPACALRRAATATATAAALPVLHGTPVPFNPAAPSPTPLASMLLARSGTPCGIRIGAAASASVWSSPPAAAAAAAAAAARRAPPPPHARLFAAAAAAPRASPLTALPLPLLRVPPPVLMPQQQMAAAQHAAPQMAQAAQTTREEEVRVAEAWLSDALAGSGLEARPPSAPPSCAHVCTCDALSSVASIAHSFPFFAHPPSLPFTPVHARSVRPGG
jgi:hypothetical protein